MMWRDIRFFNQYFQYFNLLKHMKKHPHLNNKIIIFVFCCFAFCFLPIATQAQNKGTCGDSLTWKLRGGVLTISGKGAMYNGSWDSKRDKIRKVIVKEGVTTIGDEVFIDCFQLDSVSIPNSVTRIGDKAFSGCRQLTTVSIGNSVKRIGDYAFFDCRQLTSVNIPNSVRAIGNNAFRWCRQLTSVSIGDSVRVIGSLAFHDCKQLTSIIIPNSVIAIGEWLFYGCSQLTSVNIRNSVTTIVRGTFKDCLQLRSVNIPDAVTRIESMAFSNCSQLDSINIPESVTTIINDAFAGCKNLHTVNFNAINCVVDRYLFEYCKNLKIGKQVKTIPFLGSLRHLTSIDIDIEHPVYSSQNGVLFDKEKTTLLKYPLGKSDKTYTIPNSVTTIGVEAFFEHSDLTSVTISDSVTKIEEYAFALCYNLTSIICKSNIPPAINNYTFTKPVRVIVPCGTLSAYQESNWEKIFTNIIEDCED